MSSGEWGIVLLVVGIVAVGAGSVIRRGQQAAESVRRNRPARLLPTTVSLCGVGILVGSVILICSQPH